MILIFPLTEDSKQKRDARYAKKLEKVGKGHADPTIIWIKQTVRLGFYLIIFHSWLNQDLCSNYADARVNCLVLSG